MRQHGVALDGAAYYDIGDEMTAAERYRVVAAEFKARARSEQSPSLRAELKNLALSYIRLADQAERNAATDVVYVPTGGFVPPP